MAPADPALLDEAALWVARTRDAGFRDWEGFTAWLEGDPARNAAYETALDAHDAASVLREGVVAPAPAASRFRHWPLARAAAAAALVAIVGTPFLLPRHDRYSIASAPGQQRAFRLGDGSMIALNGDSRLTLDRDVPRFARLERGEASFTVVHDPARPFTVEAGSTSIRDMGTTFNVVRGADATDVGVAEGSVLYDPDGAGVKLTAGRTLHDPDRGAIEIGDAPPGAVGAWRRGRLIYRAAPLGLVAADLARATGLAVAVDPALGARPFTGTLALSRADRAELPRRLARLAGVGAVRRGDGWLLGAGSDTVPAQ